MKQNNITEYLKRDFSDIEVKGNTVTCCAKVPGGRVMSYLEEEKCIKRIKDLGVTGEVESIVRAVGITKFKFKL